MGLAVAPGSESRRAILSAASDDMAERQLAVRERNFHAISVNSAADPRRGAQLITAVA